MPVTVDAGAGVDLPLFIVDESNPASADRLVQMFRPPLRGRLCPNCGLLAVQARLNRDELAEYRRKQKEFSGLLSDPTLSPQSPTLVKRGPGRA